MNESRDVEAQFDIQDFGFEQADKAIAGALDDRYSQNIGTVDYQPSDGKRYGLKNAETGQVLYGATAKYKTESGAVNYARRHGYEIL